MTNKWSAWRRGSAIAQAAVLLGLPFIEVGGQSALRFDVPTLRLHFFGATLWMEEFFIVLAAVFFAAFLFIYLTVVFGRLWCGWTCPQTVLSDLTAFMDKPSGGLGRALSIMAVFFLSALVAADLMWYFVTPADFARSVLAFPGGGKVTFGIWSALGMLIFLDLFLLRRTFCATVCPYAKLQGVMFDNETMRIAYDAAHNDECMQCRACVRVCPVGIDIRAGLSQACVSCAACIDACARQTSRRGKPPFIGYFLGDPAGGTATVISAMTRRKALVMAAISVVFGALFLFSASGRVPFEATVLKNAAYAPKAMAAPDGGEYVTNGYTLSLRNMSARPMDMVIEVPGATVVPRGRLTLVAGGAHKVQLYVRMKHDPGAYAVPITFVISSPGLAEPMKRAATFHMR